MIEKLFELTGHKWHTDDGKRYFSKYLEALYVYDGYFKYWEDIRVHHLVKTIYKLNDI